MIYSIFNETAASMELSSIVWYSLSSIVLGIVIAFTHKITSRYSKNFLITIATLPLLVATVMIMVNGNLGTSVAILGAFGLVRFRSLPGTSKEILSVFFAMTIGLSTGMGHLVFGTLITLIGCAVLIFLHKVPIFDQNGREKILKIMIPEDLDYEEVFEEVFQKYTKSVDLEMVKTTNMGSLFELSYRLVLKKDIREKEMIDELRIWIGNLKIMLSHPLGESDL